MDGGNSNNDARVSTPRREHFDALAQALRADAQARASGYWEERDFHAAAHDGFLALSWSGSREYAKAHAFQAAWKKEKSSFEACRARKSPVPPNVQDARKIETIKKVQQSYKHKSKGAFAQEAYIFQKESEIAPDILYQFGLDLRGDYGALPLHHYFRLSRRQSVPDVGEAPIFSRWTLEKKTYHSGKALMSDLLDEIYVDECPKEPRPPDPPCFWCIVAAVLAALVLAFAVVWAYLEYWPLGERSSLESRLGEVQTEVAGIQSQLSGIDAQYAELQRQLDELIATSATRDQIEALRTQLDAIDLRRADQDPATMGLADNQAIPGRPACLAIKTSDGRSVPDYLFAATVSPEGIRIEPHAGNGLAVNAATREAAIGQLGEFPRLPLSVAEFTAFAQPLLEAAPDCAHYVVLREDLRGPADRYAEFRQAVESRFYIYRPLGG